ncbi:hypothetical protein H0H93_010678 [Arthromyces matolae]|nr:hypothetical protein H0H93_010678 [Arthromyces matolae]
MVMPYDIQVRRHRHGKRLPQVLDDNDNDSPTVAPATVTIFVFPSSTQPSAESTPTVDPDATPTITVISDASTTVVVSSVATSVSTDGGYSSAYGYGATVNNGVNVTMPDTAEAVQTSSPTSSDASASSGTPVGAIIGIVLAIILLLTAGAVFWFRRRSIAKRLESRKWANPQPNFLFVESNQPVNVPPFPAMNSTTRPLQPYRGGDPAANINMIFAGPAGVSPTIATNNGLPYIPPPAPPRPPKAAGMYDAQTPITSPAPSSVSYGQPSSFRVPPPPVSPGLPVSPSPVKQGEAAKVRSTFIPTLPDELTIGIGEMLRILTEYDDGWTLCSNARGEIGMVPLECLDKASQFPHAQPAEMKYRRSVRVSSLATTPMTMTPKSPAPKSPYQ